jgi:hypothetical protein
MLKRGMRDEPQSQEHLTAIEHELEAARQIIDNLMARSRFSHPPSHRIAG